MILFLFFYHRKKCSFQKYFHGHKWNMTKESFFSSSKLSASATDYSSGSFPHTHNIKCPFKSVQVLEPIQPGNVHSYWKSLDGHCDVLRDLTHTRKGDRLSQTNRESLISPVNKPFRFLLLLPLCCERKKKKKFLIVFFFNNPIPL